MKKLELENQSLQKSREIRFFFFVLWLENFFKKQILDYYPSFLFLSVVEQLRSVVSNLESRVSVLEKRPAAPAAVVNGISSVSTLFKYILGHQVPWKYIFLMIHCCFFFSFFLQKTAPPPPQKTVPVPADDEDDDDDMDLFGSDDEVDEEAERLKEQRLQEYAAKKAKKPAIIAKSSILLDVKPVRQL